MQSSLTLAFGLLVLVGGLFGFVNTGSVISFVAGGTFGLLLSVSAWLMASKTTHSWGFLLAQALLVVLSCVMAYRYSLAFKFMPAGLVAVLSIALFVFNFSSRPKSMR